MKFIIMRLLSCKKKFPLYKIQEKKNAQLILNYQKKYILVNRIFSTIKLYENFLLYFFVFPYLERMFYAMEEVDIKNK